MFYLLLRFFCASVTMYTHALEKVMFYGQFAYQRVLQFIWSIKVTYMLTHFQLERALLRSVTASEFTV